MNYKTAFIHKNKKEVRIRSIIFIFTICVLFVSSCSTHIPNIKKSREIINNNNNDTVVFFIHGLMGGTDTTWTNSATKAYLPELLPNPSNLNDIDIYSINYFTELFGNKFTLKDLGSSLHYELRRILQKKKHKKIIFICHSLGNLVLRSALYENPSAYSNYQIPLIVSLASPSTGSELADIARIVFPKNTMFNNLSTNNEYIKLLNEEWKNYKGDTTISCAYEMFGYKPYGLIVSKKSASSVCTAEPWATLQNHITISKPLGSDDPLVYWLRIEIQEALERNKNNQPFLNIYEKSINSPRRAQDRNLALLKRNLKHLDYWTKFEVIQNFLFTNQTDINCNDYCDLLSMINKGDRDHFFEGSFYQIRPPISDQCLQRFRALFYREQHSAVIQLLLRLNNSNWSRDKFLKSVNEREADYKTELATLDSEYQTQLTKLKLKYGQNIDNNESTKAGYIAEAAEAEEEYFTRKLEMNARFMTDIKRTFP